MSELLPEGEELRRAVKWISYELQENPAQPPLPLVHQAIFKFDLTPRDAEFLIGLYSRRKEEP